MLRGARVHSAGKSSVVNTKNTRTSMLVTSCYDFAYLMVDSCATAWLITLIEVIWCNRTDRNRVCVGVGTVLQNIVFMPWDIKADACGMEKLCARLLRNTSIGTCTLNSAWEIHYRLMPYCNPTIQSTATATVCAQNYAILHLRTTQRDTITIRHAYMHSASFRAHFTYAILSYNNITCALTRSQ